MRDIVVMERKTWDDPKMPKPLPGRINYVATNKPIFGYGITTIRGDLQENIRKIQNAYPTKTVWIIGGPDILMETRDLVDQVHITHFKGQFKTDRQIDLRKYLSLFRATSAATSLDKTLWEKSGHWEKFQEHMYTTKTPDERVFAIFFGDVTESRRRD